LFLKESIVFGHCRVTSKVYTPWVLTVFTTVVS